ISNSEIGRRGLWTKRLGGPAEIGRARAVRWPPGEQDHNAPARVISVRLGPDDLDRAIRLVDDRSRRRPEPRATDQPSAMRSDHDPDRTFRAGRLDHAARGIAGP